MERDSQNLREVSGSESEHSAWEQVKETPRKSTLDTSFSPRGSTPVSMSLPSTSSAQMEGVSPERDKAKRPMGPSVPAGSRPAGKSQLDSLSREELVKHIKKQALMLQKVKARSDELSSKLKAQQSLNQEQSGQEKAAALEEFQVMKAERDRALAELKSVRQIIVSEEEQHRGEVAELKKKLTDLVTESKLLKEDIAAIEAARTSLKEQLSSLSDLYSALEKQTKAKEGTVTELQARLDDLSEERTALQLTKDAMVKDREELIKQEQAITDLTKEKDGLEVLVLQLQQEVASARGDLKLTVSKLEQYEDEMHQLRHQVDELQSECEKRDSENSQLKQCNVELNDKCSAISRQLEEQREREAIQQQNTDSTETELKNEVSSLRQKLSESQATEVAERRDRELELNEQVEKLTVAKQQMQATLDDQVLRHREETKKLKAFAVKLKKELGDMKEKEQVLRKHLDQLQSEETKDAKSGKLAEVFADLEKVRIEKDQLLQQAKDTTEYSQQQMESIRQQLKEEQDARKSLQEQAELLSGQLHAAQQEKKDTVASLTLEKNQLTESLSQTAERQGILESELNSLQTELATALSQAKANKKATDASMEEATALREVLSKEKQLHKETQQKLAAAEKDAKAANVIDLELADYQRSVESLRSQLADKDLLIQESETTVASTKQQVERQLRELESLKQADLQKEETLGKFKALLVKSKKELTDTRNQLTEMQQVAKSLREELEAQRQEDNETSAKVEALSEQLLAQEKEHELSLTQQQSLNCSLDTRVKSLQDELARTEMALRLAQQEHESYKVRVHSVLRQKTTGPSVTEVERSLRQDHETEVIKLKAELKATQERLSGVLADQEELSMEHEQLVTRHEQVLISSQQEHRHLQDQLLESESRFQMQSGVLEELVSQLRQDIAQNTTAFKEQIQTLQKEHSQEVERLRGELESTHAQLSRLQQEADAQVLARRPTQPQEDGTAKSKNLKEWLTMNGRMSQAPIEERSSGEGMDHSEIESAGFALTQKLVREDSASSLERLLSISDTSFTSQVGRSSKELSTAQQEQLYSAAKRSEHLTELLHESEANCVRLAEQAKLLKEEIRRLERNQERQREASNMEYLKNVVLKFLHSSADEQTDLVPVISKLLQLSVQEKQYLQETVKGNKAELPDASGGSVNREGRTKGWGSYMHRWTGY